MNIFIPILIVIAAIIGIILFVALFIKKEYHVVREINVNKPLEQVFDYIKLVKNQADYNKWWMIDLQAKKEFKGVDGTIGFVAAWDSSNKQMGKGEQEIKKIVDNNRIDCELRFIKPFEGIAQTYIATESTGINSTKVKWVFTGTNKYPMNLMNLFMSNLLGKDLQTSISTLKTLLEKQ